MTKEKEDLDRFLAYLENRISKIRQNLQKSKNFEADETFIQQIVALAKEIIKFFGIDSALEEKRRIYGNIVDFLKGKGSKRGAEHVYLSAAHQLCNETDSQLTYGDDYSQTVEEITNWVREIIIGIQVFYEKTSADRVIFRTEIYSKGTGDSSPTRSKWESEGNWADLPSKVREEFIRSEKNSLDYMWYPDQAGNFK